MKNKMLARIKPYISWSQLTTIEAGDKAYVDSYFLKKKLESPALSFGSMVADSLESGQATGDVETDLILARLPKFELMDKEFRAVLRVEGAKIPLLSKIDSAKADLSAIIEFKTGATKWTQAKVDSWGQITFYCVVAELIGGQIPSDVRLIWAETEKTDNGIRLTGKIVEFKTKRSKTDILKMKLRIFKAWERIGKLTEDFYF
jgi:hypothetical protein